MLDDDGERGRQDLQLLEKDPSLMLAGKTVPGQAASTGAGVGDYRRPSRFTDTPSGREMSAGGFPDMPPRPLIGPPDNRAPFPGYGPAPGSAAALAQSGVGDFHGLQDKMQSLYPGSSSGGPGMDTRQAPMSSFTQPPPGGMSAYSRPPPASVPPTGFGASGPHWAGAMPLATSNGRQDWRPGFGGPSSSMSDYPNPMQQQRLMGNWQADAMSFSHFH